MYCLFDKKCLLYTHQCIAKNTVCTEQWNTNQQIVFSVSPVCDFPNPYHACLTCKPLFHKGRQTRRYFEIKQPWLSPFWTINWFIHVYKFNLLKNQPNNMYFKYL